MKLLIYSHAFAPQVGGIETFTTYLAAGLADPKGNADLLRYQVVVVTQTPESGNAAYHPAGFDLVRRPTAWRLWQLVGTMDKVLITGPAILPLLFALLRGKPVIVTHHGYQSICPNGMLFHFPTRSSCPGHFAAGHYRECVRCNRVYDAFANPVGLLLLTFVRRFLSRFADLNVAVSDHVAKRINLPRTRVVRNGVPKREPTYLQLLPKANSPVQFAYLGRLVTEKGVTVLLNAAGVLRQRGRNFRIMIFGDGPEREALETQAKRLGLAEHVSFLGFQSGAQLDKLMSEVFALVIPSICEDVAPFSVLEQMMEGRLVIGSLLGGLAEQIGDSGLTFAPGDADELARQMQVVIDRPELVAKLGKSARQRALSAYTLDRMLCDYRKLLERQGESL